jgi:hypothetical protein
MASGVVGVEAPCLVHVFCLRSLNDNSSFVEPDYSCLVYSVLALTQAYLYGALLETGLPNYQFKSPHWRHYKMFFVIPDSQDGLITRAIPTANFIKVIYPTYQNTPGFSRKKAP